VYAILKHHLDIVQRAFKDKSTLQGMPARIEDAEAFSLEDVSLTPYNT
jgi:hypothetical protein